LSVYNYNGPCYRCLFPECPKAVKNCSDAGVFGVLPGFIGLLEALETIKLITGHAVLSKKMIVIDGLAGRFFTAKLRDR
jgi:adenylyltransferase/sulfurtransferase